MPASQFPSISIRAHAKVNLALAVGRPIESGPRSGMHPIATWMAPIGLADTVTIERTGGAPGFNIAWSDGRQIDWPIESDLVFRAHAALSRELGPGADPLGAHITVRKSIPAGGGLGGGSADAAATLRGLNRLFDLQIGADRLRAIASTLGSDIPFFIPDDPDPAVASPAAMVTGLGEQIDAAPVRSGGAVPLTLVFPPFGCPTGEVYRAFDSAPPGIFREAEVAALASAGVVESSDLFNDLAAAAVAVRPALGRIRDDLERSFRRRVHVSGSGSTLFCFGAMPDEVHEFLPAGCTALGSFVLCS